MHLCNLDVCFIDFDVLHYCINVDHSTVHKWFMQYVLVDTAPNSQTSLSSYESVPRRSLQTCTIQVAKHLHVEKKHSPPPHSVKECVMNSPSIYAKLLSKSEISKQAVMSFSQCSDFKRREITVKLEARRRLRLQS